MGNAFSDELEKYRQRCDMALEYSCPEVFSHYGGSDVMAKYTKVFLRHCKGGKRVRAYLVKLGFELCGKSDDDRIIIPSLSYELFQTGVLVHDDIIDNSRVRRFHPSMHVEFGDNHDGISKAICVGDFGILSAVDIISQSDFPDSIKLRAIHHQSDVFLSTIAGEIKDVELSSGADHEMQGILDMYRLKTAQYTVSGPLVLGAILAGADDDLITQLKEFGDSVGIAFQIRDDILGIYGDEKVVGKSVTSDLSEGKKTVLSAHFTSHCDDKARESFDSVYGKENADISDLEIVKKLFIDCGSLDFAKTLCEEYTEKAKKMLEVLDASNHCKAILYDLLTYMTERKF